MRRTRFRDEQLRLFRAFATPQVAEELLKGGVSLGGKHVEATAMFVDMRSSTAIAENQDPAESIQRPTTTLR